MIFRKPTIAVLSTLLCIVILFFAYAIVIYREPCGPPVQWGDEDSDNPPSYLEIALRSVRKKLEIDRTIFNNNCPVCLSTQTTILAPRGAINIRELKEGDRVFTTGSDGKTRVEPIIKVSKTRVPENFHIIHLTLEDGRTIIASAGHPTADGKTIGDLRVRDMLNNSIVTAIHPLPYHDFTYDILPAGNTGTYWANGILLKSTLEK